MRDTPSVDNKVLELSIINDSLQKDVLAREREIRRLNKDLQHYEQTMSRMRDEMNPDLPKKDAEVMAGMCCTGTECGDLVPVKDIGELLREETCKYREKIQSMEMSLKVVPFESSRVKMRAVHKINLGLIEELSTLRRLCVAIDVERRDARIKLDLEGQIVKQMVRQLRHAKAQVCPCVATSTPDGTQELPDETEISIIPHQPQPCVSLSDEELEAALRVLSSECHKQDPDSNNVHEQSTLRLDTPRSQSSRDHSGYGGHTPSDKRQKPHPDQSETLDQNESPRKFSPTPSISPVFDHSQSVRSQCDENLRAMEHTIKIPEQSQSPTKKSKAASESWHSPRKVIDPVPELIESHKKTTQTEPEGSRKGSKIPVIQQNQRTKDTSVTSTAKRKCSLLKTTKKISSVQCECEERKENVSSGENKSPKKQSEIVEPEQNSRGQSKNPVLECATNGNLNQSGCDCSQTDANFKTNKNTKPTFIRLEHFPGKGWCSETDEGSSERPTTSKESAACVTKQTQSTTKTSEDIKPKYMHSEHLPKKQSCLSEIYGESSKSTNDESALPEQSNRSRKSGTKYSCSSEIDEESSKSTNDESTPPLPEQSDSCIKSCERRSCMSEIDEESSKSTNDENAPSDASDSCRKSCVTELNQSTTETSEPKPPCLRLCQIKDSSTSDNEEKSITGISEETNRRLEYQGWLVLPEGIKKSLDLLRQTFLGKPDDVIVRLNKAYDPTTSSTPDRYSIDNTTESMRSRPRSSCLLTKSTSSCYSKDIEVQNPEKSNTTTEITSCSSPRERSSCLLKTKSSSSECKKSVRIDLPEDTNICGSWDPSEAWEDDEECCSKDIEVQNPEKSNTKIGTTSYSPPRSCLLKTRSTSSECKKSVRLDLPEDKRCESCDPSEAWEEDDGYTKDIEVQNPETCNRSQGAPTVTTEDDSDLTSRTRNSNNRDTSRVGDDQNGTSCDDKTRILGVKLLKEESTQDSGGGSSCAGTCDSYYRDKLMATLQILEHKDETIRVQSSSLSVAEGRIAELTKKASSMKQDLDEKARELNNLRCFVDSYQIEKSDASIMAEIQDAETQKLIVETLEDNLSVIEELYRECFYETAKQEDLIDLLRKSYLDVRLMERDKSDKIMRLQNVVLTQKRSLEQCQDVVLEVESLKSEISCFLNSSNNDSGMWERGSECPDVSEELTDILEQLVQLQVMLTSDSCTCGFKEENEMLKEKCAALDAELDQLRQEKNELKVALSKLLEQQFEKKLKDKERELQEVSKQLADAENCCEERSRTCETLKRQLQQAQVLLEAKTADLLEVQKVRAEQDATIRQLQQDLEQSERNVGEGLKKLAEVTRQRSEQAQHSQATILDLERRLQRAVVECRKLEQSCREKEHTTSELQASLEDAQARGASLCEESRRVTARVRSWMRHKRALLSEQEEKIKRQEAMLREIQSSAGTRPSVCDRTSQSETEPCCSNTPPDYLASDASYPRCSRLNKPVCRSETDRYPRYTSLQSCVERDNETASCSKCVSNRQEGRDRGGGSEMASCSRAPVPPRRQKRQPRDDVNWSCGRYSPELRWSVESRRWLRRSPTEDILERVEHLHAALAAGQRRWGRKCRR